MRETEPLRSALEVKQVKFTGSLDYDENGTLHRTFQPGEIQYIGEPNAEIDAAWEALVKGAEGMLYRPTSVLCAGLHSSK